MSEFTRAYLQVKKTGTSQTIHNSARDDMNPSLSIWRKTDGSVGVKDHGADGNLEPMYQAEGMLMLHSYTDEDGLLLYQSRRINFPDGSKEIKQRQPDGPGNWIWSLKDVRRVLYNLPNVLGSEVVYIVEGEKCADALIKLGLTATTIAGGAKSRWQEEFSEALQDKILFLLPDNDEPGRQFMERVAASVNEFAETTRIVDLGLTEKGADVYDWLNESHTAEELEELAYAAPLWFPTSLTVNITSNTAQNRHCTDMGNAERFVDQHGKNVRYCEQLGQWLIWNENRWVPDNKNEIYVFAKKTIRNIYKEAEVATAEKRQSLVSWAYRCEFANKDGVMIQKAGREPCISIQAEELDQDPWQLNTLNGTIDLKTIQCNPPRREHLITKLANVNYDSSAKCPLWEKFLKRVVPDQGTREFLQRAIGYSLTGDVREQVLLFLWGEGSNGKSTFLNTILTMLGNYGMQATSDLLLMKNGNDHPTKLTDLQAMRFVSTVEVDDGARMAEGLVKVLTGGEKIRARKMRQDFYEFDPTHKIFLAANHRPFIQGTDYAIWRRIRLVPFTEKISGDEKDPLLLQKLQTELPGILNWALEGCRLWQQDGLKVPTNVTEATEGYREEQDLIGGFLSEMCYQEVALKIRVSELYKAYDDWCFHSGEKAKTKKQFGETLRERGIVGKKQGGDMWYVGITLQSRCETTLKVKVTEPKAQD